VALAELRTNGRLAAASDPLWLDVVLDVPDVAGAAAAVGAAATARDTPIPAVANPIARSGRTGMTITFPYSHVKYRSVATTLNKLPKAMIPNRVASTTKPVIPSELSDFGAP
jgi:hypothetical protein